jgi:trk system potassium uptake protein TrkH
MSGFSTTGASIIPDVSVLSTGFHFWRLLMGWFGGVGIVLISVIFIPTLQSMGMILFKIVGMETFDHSLSKARQTVIGIVILYFVATIVFTIILNIVGEISFFDSLIHIMSSISTTGLSNKNESVMYFASYKVEWIICFVMFLSGSPYILMYYAVFLRKFNLLIKDQQFIGYFYLIVIISIILSVYLFLYNGFSILDSLTKATFSTLSMLTGTGMANIDYTKINPFMTMVLFFTMMVGGCAGSAAGGLKIYRLQVFFKIAKISIKKIFLTNRVIVPYYNGRPVSSDSAMAILSYIILFFVTLVVFSCVLSAMGLDFITAISSAVACLSGVGPGIGGIVGPVGNYSLLPDSAKWVLSIAMFMGRI